MSFVLMDLIGKFKLSHQGHKYALTVNRHVDELYLAITTAGNANDEVVHAYLVNI